MQSSDIFCLPTLREPGGGAILEAMACGLPIITTNYGGPKYSVNESCGIKIETINQIQFLKDLESALLKLIKDRELRKTMGQESRKRAVNNFSKKALSSKILQLYSELEFSLR